MDAYQAAEDEDKLDE